MLISLIVSPVAGFTIPAFSMTRRAVVSIFWHWVTLHPIKMITTAASLFIVGFLKFNVERQKCTEILMQFWINGISHRFNTVLGKYVIKPKKILTKFLNYTIGSLYPL